MSQAINEHSTPTRRSADGFSLAAFTAGLTVPALAEVANPDAELRDLVKTMDREWEVTEAIVVLNHPLIFSRVISMQ
jgi:hypothetical protein